MYLLVINKCLDLSLQLGYLSLFTTTLAKDSSAVRLNICSAAAEPGVGRKHVPGVLWQGSSGPTQCQGGRTVRRLSQGGEPIFGWEGKDIFTHFSSWCSGRGQSVSGAIHRRLAPRTGCQHGACLKPLCKSAFELYRPTLLFSQSVLLPELTLFSFLL